MKTGDIDTLARLARIGLTDSEKERLANEFGEILSYVDTIQKISDNAPEPEKPPLRNIFRVDEEPHESGVYTEELLKEAPQTTDNFIKVKKIL